LTREEQLKFIKRLMDKTNEAIISATELSRKEMKKIIQENSNKPGSGSWERK